MPSPGQRALFQPFLPDTSERAFVWKYSEPVGGRRPRHFHLEPELNVVVSGSAVFGVGERAVHVRRGELLVFPAAQDHALLDASPDLYLYAIGLDAAYSADVLGTHFDPVPLHVRLEDADLDAVVERAAALVDRAGTEQAGAELWERAHWLGRRAVPGAARAPHVLTRRAMERLRNAPELGLDSLAEQVGAHPSEVSRHFHRDVGMTLVRYRTRLRLLHFIRLLDSRRSDMGAAASAAGFGSYSQCHRSFQAELGCAPRQFFSGGVREEMQRTYAT